MLSYVRAVLRADTPSDAADLTSLRPPPRGPSTKTTPPPLPRPAGRLLQQTPCLSRPPVAVSSALVRRAGSCVLQLVKPALRAAVGASQYSVCTPNGLESVLFGVRAAMEGQGKWLLQLDVANAFNEVSRERI